MKNLKLKIILTFPLFIFLLAFPLEKIRAQTLGLSLYPPLLEVMIKPGKAITQAYQIANQSKSDLIMTSKIIGFEPADELGNIQLKIILL